MHTKLLSSSIALAMGLSVLPAHAQDCRTALADARGACAEAGDAGRCLRERLPEDCRHLAGGEPADATTLSRITVLGTGYALDVSKYPGSASVVLPEELDFGTDIIKSLERVPGFDSGNDVGRALGQSFSIRGWGHGSESRTILMLDGVRRSANLFANQSSSFGMDSDLIKQVEVIRGSSSIHHGGGAIGGVVNAVTRDASDFILPGSDVGGTFKLRYDSNNAREGYAAFGLAPQDGRFEFLAFLKRHDKGDIKLPEDVPNGNGTFRRHNDNDEQIDTQFLKAAWHVADGHKLSLSHFRYSLNVESLWNSLYHYEYSPTLGPVVGERRQSNTVLRYVAAPDGNPWLNLAATAYRSEGWYERGYKFGADLGTDLYYKNLDERRGFSVQNLMRFRTGAVNHRLLVGADYEVREEDGIYVLNGVTTDFQSMPNEYNDLGLFVQHESGWFGDRLLVQLGGRYDRFDREVQGVAEGYDNSRFSPRVGASFEAAPGFNLLANYSEAFRAPTPHETSSEGALNPYYWYTPNPDLQPEISAEYEFGFSLRRQGLFRADGRFNAKLMYFTGEIEDMIDLVVDHGSVSPAGSEYVQYRNVGEVERRGFELETSYDAERWGGYLNYETLDQYDAQTRKKTPWAFADRARAGVRWRPVGDDLELSAMVTHWFAPDQNPETIVSGGQTLYYVRKSFSQTDLQARWRPHASGVGFLDGSTQVLFGVNNVFNQKRMSPSVVETNSRIGVGRNVYLSVSKTF